MDIEQQQCEICDGKGGYTVENEFGVEVDQLCECTLDRLDRETGMMDDEVNFEQE